MNTYNPAVRIGNWNEDVSLSEDLLKDFLAKKERGELLIQKTSYLKKNLLQKVNLSVSNDGFVHFGDTIMLVNPGNEKVHLDSTDPPHGPLSLAINPEESKVHTCSSIEAPCGISAIQNLEPSVRNTFVITSVDGTALGKPLLYGQNFALRTTEGFAGQLYLASDHKTFLKNAKKSRLQEINLTNQYSYLTHWQVLYIDPQFRMEYEGYPVHANANIIFDHCKTNQCLAVFSNYVLWTPYGKEYEVAVHTLLDSHKAERDVNHWLLVTGSPSGETTIVNKPGS
ncbi:cilia- and flagella-associated protein 161 [Protopterus annectens]|uniref:cilia- and flagella-associated protein 161 n=1 Tax=Protopterus annectens TaxID=7888 RepID=UPI001CFAD482|nr:cilia- and flagella-associated protein 161 [Protopterus annectens]